MLFRGSLIAQASGSVAGNTFSRNRGGQYIRNRATPINPNTAQQIAVRSAFADLSNLWSEILTQGQRDAWNTYAANVPVLNRLGDSIFLTGFNMYIRSNTSRMQAGIVRNDDGPTDFNLGSFTPTTSVAKVTADAIEVSFTAADLWVNEDGAHMMVYTSRSVAPTIDFFKGPFQFAGTIDGDGVTPPTSPATITNPFTNTLGNRAYVRVRVTTANARLSNDEITNSIIVA